MRSCYVVLLWILVTPAVFCAPEFVPTQERAQGHSLTGSVQFNDSLYSNPAASAFVQVYSIEGSLAQGALAASVVDTKTSYVGGALGYLRLQETPSRDKLESLRLGFCRKITDVFAVGVLGKTIWNASQRLNDIDAGLLAKFSVLEVGVVARNTLGGKIEFMVDQQREYSAGGRLNFKDTLYFSASTTSTHQQLLAPYEYGVGAEFISPYFFSIKGGYRWERISGESHWSAGLSLLSPRFIAHYAVEFANDASKDSEHQVAVSLLF